MQRMNKQIEAVLKTNTRVTSAFFFTIKFNAVLKINNRNRKVTDNIQRGDLKSSHHYEILSLIHMIKVQKVLFFSAKEEYF